MISLNSVRPFCWFHTYYLITTRFRINNAKISRVIILLSNRTLSALKCPVYKGFQKIFITQTRQIQRYSQTYLFKFCIFFAVILFQLYILFWLTDFLLPICCHILFVINVVLTHHKNVLFFAVGSQIHK